MKRLVAVVLCIIFLVTINNLSQAIYNLWQKQTVVETTQAELKREQARNETLKKELQHVEKTEFVEQEARNKLLMSKEGEKLVLLPSQAVSPTPVLSKKQAATVPTWEQWKGLFW